MAALPYILAAISAISAYKGAQDSADAADYKAKVDQVNADATEGQGEAAAQAQKRDAARRIGAMVAGYGASGVQLSDGSPADVLSESARMAELDVATVKYNYKLKALNYQTQASIDKISANNFRTSASIYTGGVDFG